MRYDKPLWQIILSCLEGLPTQFTVQEIITRVEKQYPGFDDKSVRRALRFMAANDDWYMASVPKNLFKIDRSSYRLYNPETDPPPPALPEETEDPFRFPLEMLLEEFMESHWSRINFGRPLRLYVENGVASGRQFRTPVGIIDFLCEDTQTGDFVVVELKKDSSTDRVLGQCQRYMGWVQQNLAKPGQQVWGLIIAVERDERLKFALKVAPNVQVLCYRVDFQLFDPDGEGL